MATRDGSVYLYDPSTGWRSIRTETGTDAPYGLWGEPDNLFEFSYDGLRRWDGSRWIELVVHERPIYQGRPCAPAAAQPSGGGSPGGRGLGKAKLTPWFPIGHTGGQPRSDEATLD